MRANVTFLDGGSLVMNIGVVLPNWIGDVVMATPTLRALRSGFGDQATLTGIVRPYAAEVLAGLPWLDEYLHYDPGSSDRALNATALIRHLRERKLDSIVLLTNSLRTAMIAWLSGAKQRVGYVRYGRGPLLTARLQPPKVGRQLVPVSAVDYYLELAYALGCPEEPRKVELATTEEDEQAADHVWRKLGLCSASRVVALNSGGAYGAAKHWQPDYFADLAKRLIRDSGTAVLMLCGPNERDTAAEIIRLASDPRVTSLAGEALSLGLSKACVRRSQLLISTDSGPRHFAAGFNVPSVVLFGATDP
ncbi:MAG: glycosyltransferase family 9 protein, partial [Pirellulaceae bacterium]